MGGRVAAGGPGGTGSAALSRRLRHAKEVRFDQGGGVAAGRTVLIVALVATVAVLAEEPCEPGEGGYPLECPGIARIVVCDWGPLVDDDEGQCETFIAAIQRECEVTLAGIWIDQGNPNDNPAVNHIAVSLSDDGGETWRPPGGDFELCQFMGDDPRRFLNGCYFSECVGDPLECDLLPNNCVPYVDSP